MKTNCSYIHCGKEIDKPIGEINRAKKRNGKIFCNLQCAGAGKRLNRSEEEKKLIKADYDRKFRELNADKIKLAKHEYFKKTYNKEAAAIERKKNMPRHVEYCRRPEYKEKKKQYDKIHAAKRFYGEYWESALIIDSIEELIDDKEVRQINNLHNKTQKRKQKWKQHQKQHSLQRI